MFRERKLLRASLAGDRNAFEKIVEKYQSAICAITFSGTGRLDVSEELAQETFVNAWEHLGQLRDLNGFRSWLYSIARNTLRNYRRQKKPASTEAQLTDVATEATDNPPEILMRKEEQMMLEQAIMRLPAKYREPLVLFCRQQQSVRQAAEVLGLSEATVRTRLHRARNLLREQVAERLEYVLKETGPRKDFTKAVMVAISTLPIGLSATADAASSAIQGHAAVTNGISTLSTSVGMKIAAVTALVAAGTLIYTYSNNDKSATLMPEGTPEITREPSITPPQSLADTGQGSVDENPVPQATERGASPGESHEDRQYPGQRAAATEEPASKPVQTPPETTVTGIVLDKNTLSPVAGARVGFKRTETTVTDSHGRFTLSHREAREEALIYAMASGYATERITLRVNPGDRQDVLFKVQPGLTLVGTVIDPNQKPIENVKVSVHSLRLGSRELTTNSQGQFKIEGLDPEDGLVYVSAEHADYVPDSSVTVKLGALGEEIFAEVILTPKQPGAVLCGQVTNTQSEPVAQAAVGWLHTQIKTTTDHEGRYALENSDAGSSSLYVTHPRYAVFVEDVSLPAEAKETRLDVQLASPSLLSGRVIDDRGNPVSDAAVGIESYGGKKVWGLAGLFHSDPEGNFTIPNAPSQGNYRLLVFGDGIHHTSHTVTSSHEECLITVSHSGRVYGCVIDGDTGHPIPRFRVAVEASGMGLPAMWTLDGYTFTSEKGHFDTGRLELVDDQPLPLTVYAEGYDPLTLDSVPVQPISDEPDRTVFRLQRNTRRSTLYVGRVVDQEGRAISAAEIGFRPERATLSRRGFSRVVTDASGTYMISSIDPHEQILFARAPGYAPSYCRMSELLLEAPGVFADIVLDPGATVVGYAWDELGRPIANTRIASSFTVRSMEEHEFMEPFQILWPETRTDEQGHYQLTDLPIGEVQLQLLSTGHQRIAPQKVTVTPGDSVELNFGDRGGFVISGVVVEGENLLEHVEVQLKSMDKGPKSHSDRTDASGRFKLIHVPAGQYVFAALRPQEGADEQAQDPNDQSHILYEVMDIQSDLDLAVDYQTRSIGK